MIRATEGSMSTFLIILLTAFLFVFFVLGDVIQAALARHTAHQVVRSALRSSLADYDRKLSEYGLYGTSSAKAKSAFDYVLEQHRKSKKGTFSLLQTTELTGEVALDSRLSLGDHTILRQQILEDIKYAAPIEFVLELVGKFKQSGMQAQVLQGTTFYRQSEKIEELIQERDKALDVMWSAMEKWMGADGWLTKRNQLYDRYHTQMQQFASLAGEWTEGRLNDEIRSDEETFTSLQNEYVSTSSSITTLEFMAGELEEEDPSITKEIEYYNDQLDRISTEMTKIVEQLEKYRKELKNLVLLQKEIDKWQRDVASDQSASADQLEKINTPLLLAHETEKKLTTLIDNLLSGEEISEEEREILNEAKAEVLIGDLYFRKTMSDLGEISAMHQTYIRQVGAWSVDTGKRHLQLEGDIRQRASDFYTAAIQLDGGQRAFADQQRSKRAKQEHSKKDLLAKVKEAWKQVSSLAFSCNGNSNALYSQLTTYYVAYRSTSELLADGESDAGPIADGEDTSVEQTMDVMEYLQKAMLVARDDIYVNEYILSRFNFRTSDKGREASIHPERKSHPLATQEAEYVLYGLNSCEANQGAAFAELFAVRMGIRTIEALLSPNRAAGLGSPLLYVLYAAAQGAIKAVEDVRKLMNGQEVRLSDRLPASITLNYKDYLRLFLLMHGGETNKLLRIQALLQLNTGAILYDRLTYTEGTVRIDYRTRIIPQSNEAHVQSSYMY